MSFPADACVNLLPHLRLLRALAAVTQAGSSQRAAALLHVAQSSVTRAVVQLENQLSCRLFERSGRGMSPTAQGDQLALRVTRALQYLADADRHRTRHAVPAWHGSPLALGVTARHLQVLQALVDTGSEGRAALLLGISQSAVHQSLQQLEHMTGSRLFIRSRSGMRLDDAGESLLLACHLVQAELRQATEEWPTPGLAMQGQLVIGTLPFSTTMLLAPAVEQLLRHQPEVRVVVIDGTFDALVTQLRHAKLDCIVGALRSQLPATDVMQELLFEDRLAVIARAGHPLAVRHGLDWPALHTAQWVMPMPNTPAELAFTQMLNAAGLAPPAQQVRANSALMMQAMLCNSDRLALMSPRQVAREVAAGLLTELPLPVQHTRRRIGAMWRSGYLPTPAAAQWQNILRQVGQTLDGLTLV
ncbi:HTH-type transcriptional regulator ArgP [Rhodoferax lithotrophicus]|uniref:HTH-type transcriptional regulator ArgP n=1 Tax=Rhodoferax lithotrophicus TaxID=2798804 RepID=A0ABN6D7F0_9BURK|nr:LysR family transcriptional regulator [Rhodoferax sp. MIZ03]BCO27618.1 HTH-type transcriptional regulator ArgP [Rhodoferax sp. MIZ03]